MLSDQSHDQTSTSFIYYCPDKQRESSPKNRQLIDQIPQETRKTILPALVHTISTYRKQQREHRISGDLINEV